MENGSNILEYGLDHIIKGYASIFGGLAWWHPASGCPALLKGGNHGRPCGFVAQNLVYVLYHMVGQFWNNLKTKKIGRVKKYFTY